LYWWEQPTPYARPGKAADSSTGCTPAPAKPTDAEGGFRGDTSYDHGPSSNRPNQLAFTDASLMLSG